MVVAFTALAVARRLHRGYVGALARSLELRADQMPSASADDAAALLQTVGGFDLSQLRGLSRSERPAPKAPETTPELAEEVDPEARRLGRWGWRRPGWCGRRSWTAP